MDKEIVKELIQKDLITEKLTKELKLISEGEKRKEIKENYIHLIEKLGGEGASAKTAGHIFTYMR